MDTNLFGFAYLIDATLPILCQQRSGHIIEIPPQGSRIPPLGLSGYHISKDAVEDFTVDLAHKVAVRGHTDRVVQVGFAVRIEGPSPVDAHGPSAPNTRLRSRVVFLKNALHEARTMSQLENHRLISLVADCRPSIAPSELSKYISGLPFLLFPATWGISRWAPCSRRAPSHQEKGRSFCGAGKSCRVFIF
jgi:NAD(P)-dependent dehydrogenase (short-subunit alcohol dehydrogenase family)